MSFEGGCYCGAVRYKSDGDIAMRVQCHCRECQYLSGGGANFVAGVPEGGYHYTKGQPKIYRRSDLPNPVTREFCGNCGTPLTSRTSAVPGVVLVKVGSMDRPADFAKPDFVVFTCDQQPYHHVPDGVPAFAKMPS